MKPKLDTIIEFDGKKCRTARINDVSRYILQIDKELDEN